jgi:hypothetical protein
MAKRLSVTSPPLVISPELVLVDPELAVLSRESLRERAAADAAPARSPRRASASIVGASASPPPVTPAPKGWRGSVRSGLFALSVAANLLLLLMFVDSRSGSLPQLVVAPPLRPPVASSEARPSRAAELAPVDASVSGVEARQAKQAASRQLEGVVTEAQKRVLAGLPRDATLRRRFVDPSTGLPRTGVSARCRPRGSAPNGAATLRCVVEGQLGQRRVTSTVRYQTLPNGRYSIAVNGLEHAG